MMRLYNSSINVNFGYCSLVWILCGKCNLRKIEKLQERTFRIVYQDSKPDYGSLIGKSGQLSLRHEYDTYFVYRNLQMCPVN